MKESVTNQKVKSEIFAGYIYTANISLIFNNVNVRFKSCKYLMT